MRPLILLAFAILTGVIAAGCHNSTSPVPEATATPTRAIVITGNGGSTTVFVPSSDPANPVVYCSTGTEVCPECKAAAVKYFQTGVLDPKCSRTGATRTAVTYTGPGHSVN